MSAGVAHPDVARSTDRAWLFSPAIDLGVFLGSALLSLLALSIGARFGVLRGETPDWAWVPAVLLVDVAHVWATAFRTYLDPIERARRPWLYTLVPLLAFVAAFALHGLGEAIFWRVLAYVAIFHFVRQQYGFVMLYRARAGERDRLGKVIDVVAIHAAMLYPLLHWHTHLPKRFSWFVPGDVVALPPIVERIAAPLYVLSLVAYVVSAIARRGQSPGKHVVVGTTALVWFVGIIALDSDYAFTVTNVFIHGIPYFALVFFFARRASNQPRRAPIEADRNEVKIEPRAKVAEGDLWRNAIVARGIVPFLATLWVVAYVEELLWDRAVFQERAWLFGEPWELGPSVRALVVALLVVPQLTHYVLDGFIWRRRSNPEVAAALT